MRAWWLIASLTVGSSAMAQDAPLFAIPTETAATDAPAIGEGLKVALYSRNLAGLATLLGAATPAPTAERLEYTLAGYPQRPGSGSRTWLEPTFVVDYDEPDPVRLYEALTKSAGASPTRQQLVDFVASTVTGSHSRGWDIASAVARNRDGDCSEYAVLTTAMARAAHMPARVVLGVVILTTDQGHAAYGHAWSEVQEGGRWVVADAALHNAQATIRYLPFGSLNDEGPGYMIDLSVLMGGWVQRIVVLQPEKARVGTQGAGTSFIGSPRT
jgi:hypothetical protein